MTKPPALEAGLQQCELEPIHIPGLVQPHGALFVFSKSDRKVRQASANAGQFLGCSMDRILDQLPEQIFSGDSLNIAQWLEKTSLTEHAVSGPMLHQAGSAFETAAHEFQGNLYLELFKPACANNSAPLSLTLLKSALAPVEQALTLAASCQKAAEEVQRFTGFDRVMIYKFFDDDSGTVVAEATYDGLESFQNHHFPASDIPRQAREMYRKSWVRIIPDIDAVSVPLVSSVRHGTLEPLDMTHCLLRSVSPIHLEYLRNMRVGASMSLSIMKDDRLWGLVACHHRLPKYVSSDSRIACELIVQLLAVQISRKERQETANQAKELHYVQQFLVDALSENKLFKSQRLEHHPEVLEAAAATGFVFQLSGRVVSCGDIPDAEILQALWIWLDAHQESDILAIDCLPMDIPFRETLIKSIAGFLAIRIAHRDSGYVVWFRPEWVHTITWAGDPAKPAELGNGGLRLNPRRSFQLWQEEVQGRSRPWLPFEHRWAAELRRALIEIVLRRTERELAQLNRTLESRVHERTQELEIAGERIRASLKEKEVLLKEVHHRVKNNLQVISSLLRLQSNQLGDSKTADLLTESRNRIQSMALIHDLLYQSSDLSHINFKNYLGTLLTHLFSSYDGEQRGLSFSLSADDISVSLDAAIPCGLIMTELVSNAFKHAFAGRSGGRVDVTLGIDAPGSALLSVEDNGIGLPRDLDWQRSSSLGFTIIQALCRQIKGTLEASARADGGTCFKLKFLPR